MRLALITQDFPPEIGGIQTYCLELAKRLQPMCEDFVLIAPNKPTAQQIDAELPFDVERINTPNTLLGIKGLNPAIRILKARKTTVVFHAQWHTLPIGIRAKKLGIVDRIVAATHGRELFFNPFAKIPLLKNLYNNYRRRIIKQCDYFFPVSHFNLKVLNEYFKVPENKQTVVNNGTNPDEFYPLNSVELKKLYNYEDELIVLTTARLVNRKGIDTVLNALPLVIKTIPNLKYLVVGSGPYLAELEKLTKQLNLNKYVEFVGRVPSDKLNEYYNLADVFVLASKAELPEVEGFGIVYLEANACEKPTIGTRSGGIPDAILHEKTGLLVEERNHNQLAEAIIGLLSNKELRHKMGKYGRQRVEQEANWNAVTQRIFACLVK